MQLVLRSSFKNILRASAAVPCTRVGSEPLSRARGSITLANKSTGLLCTQSIVSSHTLIPLAAQHFVPTNQRRGMKIYTKTGDTGTSGLFNGERRQKDDDVFEALGVCDELNASIGVSIELCEQAGLKDVCAMLEEISSRLFDVGSAIATPLNSTTSPSKLAHTSFSEANVEWLEKRIDEMDLQLPELKNFILPSGGLAATNLHLARTLARRAERRAWPLIRTAQVDPIVGKYLNRLSDFLFATARLVAKRTGAVEKIYKKARVVGE